MKNFDIWSFQSSLTRRLITWSFASIAIGILLLFFEPIFRGIGIQFIAWGGVDLLIAVFGMVGTNKRKSRLSTNELSASAPKESSNLKRILLINTALDVLYMVGGIVLILTLGASNDLWHGHGIGILIQGGFLFFFDLIHALQIQ